MVRGEIRLYRMITIADGRFEQFETGNRSYNTSEEQMPYMTQLMAYALTFLSYRPGCDDFGYKGYLRTYDDIHSIRRVSFNITF